MKKKQALAFKNWPLGQCSHICLLHNLKSRHCSSFCSSSPSFLTFLIIPILKLNCIISYAAITKSFMSHQELIAHYKICDLARTTMSSLYRTVLKLIKATINLNHCVVKEEPELRRAVSQSVDHILIRGLLALGLTIAGACRRGPYSNLCLSSS